MNERLNRRHALMSTDRLAWFHVKPGVNRVVRQRLACLHNACARPSKAASRLALLAHSCCSGSLDTHSECIAFPFR